MTIKKFACKVRAKAVLSRAIVGKKTQFNFIKYPTGATKGGFKRLIKSGRNGRKDGRVYSHEHGN